MLNKDTTKREWEKERLVTEILRGDLRSRDDDALMYCSVLWKKKVITDASVLRQMYDAMLLESYETYTRIRRQVQQYYSALKGNTRDLRKVRAEKLKEHFNAMSISSRT